MALVQILKDESSSGSGAAGLSTMVLTGVRSSRASFVEPGARFGGSHRRTHNKGCVGRTVAVYALVQPERLQTLSEI